MHMNVKCPMCGHDCRMPESALGQAVNCPACSKPFQCGTLSPRSLVTHPIAAAPPAQVHSMPQARGVGLQPDQNIHYRCSRCAKPLESPVHMAGQKLNCPDCGQRLQIPQPSAPPAAPAAGPVPVWSSPSAQKEELWVVPVEPAAPPPAPVAARRENCLECGVDVTGRLRLQSCPDCGSLFCSAMCYREHRYHAHPRRR